MGSDVHPGDVVLDPIAICLLRANGLVFELDLLANLIQKLFGLSIHFSTPGVYIYFARVYNDCASDCALSQHVIWKQQWD